MHSRPIALTVALLTLLCASHAHAKGLCFNSTSRPATANSPDILIVATGFGLPAKGKCKAVTGFEVASAFAEDPFKIARPVRGTACRNSEGSQIFAGFVIHSTMVGMTSFGGCPIPVLPPPVHVSMTLPYPGLANGRVHV